MRSLYCFVVLLTLVKSFAYQLKQEHATMNFCNTKYVTECYGITRRSRRGEPYKTNFTATIRYTWGNNVTIKVELYNVIKVEVVKTKLCDVRNVDWLFEYLTIYAHIDGHCPYKPGPYGLFNMEFPPKNFPRRIMSLLNGNFRFKFFFLVTETEEVIIESTLIFHTM